MNDVSVPHPNYYRPSVRYKARDGFCPLGPKVAAPDEVGDPDQLAIRTYVDGALIQTTSTSDLVRPAARLLADVTEFMTLSPGDILALGAAAPAPRARAAQTVAIEIDGIGPHRESARRGARVMRARVAYAGAIHEASPRPWRGRVRLADGRDSPKRTWFGCRRSRPQTILALGLNYADHAKELAFKSQDEPLVFLKGPGTPCSATAARRAGRPRSSSCITSASWPS